MNPKFFALLSLLAVTGCTSPDQQLVTAPIRRTRLDSLTTAQQVQMLLRTQPNFQAFTLSASFSDSTFQRCAIRPSCATPGRLSSWVKADFDGNGRTDLLVTGYTRSDDFERGVLCLLDSGRRTLGRVWLTDEKHACGIPQLIQLKGQPAIRYASYQIDDWQAQNAQSVCRADTLIFNKTQFIEYNATPRNYQIQRISFSTTECYGACPIFSLQVAADGAATYQAEEYNERKGTFTTVVTASARQELWTLLNYLDFPKLQDHYAIGATDNPTCTLTITYAGGKVKTIEDYGEQGTFGLRRAYELLFALRTTQAWK